MLVKEMAVGTWAAFFGAVRSHDIFTTCLVQWGVLLLCLFFTFKLQLNIGKVTGDGEDEEVETFLSQLDQERE